MKRSAGQIARQFLVTVWDSDPPTVEALSIALDELICQANGVPFANCAEVDLEPPTADGPKLYRAVADRFPDLGCYPIADPLASVDDDKMIADAIDDLADLTRDLNEVVWREENLGAEDAAWFFRINYFHWARHARELALYLHARQHG